VFARSDFELLAEQLSTIAGQFILTINANDDARRVFERFEMEVVDTTYSISTAATGSAKRVQELIVHKRRACPATFNFGR
jgi:DNA adenine methylase